MRLGIVTNSSEEGNGKRGYAVGDVVVCIAKVEARVIGRRAGHSLKVPR